MPSVTRRVWASLLEASLGVKIVILSALLSATVIGATVANLKASVTTKRLLAEDLGRNQRNLVILQKRNRDQLLWASSLVTENPTLRAAMETYRIESSIAAPRAELLTTIQREVGKIVGDLGRDLLVVTDDRGRVLAVEESHGGGPPIGTDLSEIPVVHQAIAMSNQGDWGSQFAMVAFGGHRYQVGSVPIVLQGFPIGSLILGDQLEETLIRQLREAFEGEILVATRDSVLWSSFHTSPRRVAAALAGIDFSGVKPATARLEGEDFVVARLTLGKNEVGDPVGLYLLESLTSATSRLNGALFSDYVTYGVLAVLLAGLGAVVAARAVLDPFGRFVGFIHSVASSADWTRRFDASGSPREIQTLNDSYNHLVDSLAENHAQLAQRTEELSQANATLTEEISERKLAEEALRASEEQLLQSQKMHAVGTLAGGVAHDFNNLLTVISSYTQLVIDEVDPDSSLHRDLDQVQQAARRATLLTSQLLAFSRKQIFQPKVIDLNAVIGGIETMLRPLIGEDIDIQTVKCDPIARVKADPGQIEQVIMNLVVNSRDAMPKGGTLAIETANVVLDETLARKYGAAQPGPNVMLAVSDTGVGMDEETRSRLFEPFFTTKTTGKGTGLGLSIVYGIVKQSHGTVWVSTELGRGTTVTIYLPQVNTLGEPVERKPGSRATRHSSETTLLVEDNVGPDSPLLAAVGTPTMSDMDLADRPVRQRRVTGALCMSGPTEDMIEHHGALNLAANVLQNPFAQNGLSPEVHTGLDLSPGDTHAPAQTG